MTKRFILWLNYHTEGWEPTEFDTLEEIAAHIQNGHTYGQSFVITERIPFVLAK